MTRSKTLVSVVRPNIVEVLNLPDEPEAGYHGLPEPDISDKLRNAGYYELIGYCNNEHPDCDDRKCDTNIYRKREKAKQIEAQFQKPNTLPCGHSGIHNIKHGEGYMCQKQRCGKRFSRETVETTFFATE